MFVLSKIYLFIANPGFWVMILLALGALLLWTRWQRAGRLLLTGTVLFVVLITVAPVGSAMIALLEDRFSVVAKVEGRLDGIVVLGGTVNQFVSAYRGQPALTDGAERLTEAVGLARRFPDARVVFSGGSGIVARQDLKEAEVARTFFAQMGVDPARLTFESQSRNTYENAVFTRDQVGPKPGERWLLVTSATHMPRAMGCFRAAGWTVEAYPVDFSTAGMGNLGPSFDMTGGLESLSAALREYMALAVYRVLGRTKSLFPAP
jgi:uncharacterized SAM-binding protein YcdF (DUF218 family)